MTEKEGRRSGKEGRKDDTKSQNGEDAMHKPSIIRRWAFELQKEVMFALVLQGVKAEANHPFLRKHAGWLVCHASPRPIPSKKTVNPRECFSCHKLFVNSLGTEGSPHDDTQHKRIRTSRTDKKKTNITPRLLFVHWVHLDQSGEDLQFTDSWQRPGSTIGRSCRERCFTKQRGSRLCQGSTTKAL